MASAQRAIAVVSATPLANTLAKETGVAASVIIATRNKATYLDLTLAALERQIFPAGMWEVIVVDDASQDNTAPTLNKYAKRGALRLVSQHLPFSLGIAQSRYKALELAKGNILIFLGEDCLPVPNFLIHHLRQHLNGHRVALGDCSRVVHTHLFSHDDILLNGTSAHQVIEADDLIFPEKIRPFIFNSGYNSRQDINNPLQWFYTYSLNASIPRQVVTSYSTHLEVPVCFEPQAFILRQLSAQFC